MLEVGVRMSEDAYGFIIYLVFSRREYDGS